MAHVTNKAFYMLNADVAPTFNPGATGGVATVIGASILYFHVTGTTWTRVNVGALSGADGNETPITRGNATTGVAPTAGEIPGSVDGDSASVYLTDGKLEKWVKVSGTWTLGYTLQGDLASNLAIAPTATNATVSNSNGTGFTLAAATAAVAGLMTASDKNKLDFITVTASINLDTLKANQDSLVTLSGVSTGATNLGTFSGSIITNSSTIKTALQELETAIENISDFIQSVSSSESIALDVDTGVLTATLRVDATEDNLYWITSSAAGIRLTPQTLTAYDSFSDAQASALVVGNSFVLSVDNIEGIPSDGVTGPVFRKQ